MQDDAGFQLSSVTLVGGFDLSCRNADGYGPAVATMTVCEYPTMTVVAQLDVSTYITTPYVPSFLAFREVPIYKQLFEMYAASYSTIPQVLLVDGNGVFHSRQCGLATHLGVVLDCPTIGVAKTLYQYDQVALPEHPPVHRPTCVRLTGQSGRVWCSALYPTRSNRPLIVSSGHRISLDTAEQIVQQTCIFKQSQPIRLSDLRSRQLLQFASTSPPFSASPPLSTQ